VSSYYYISALWSTHLVLLHVWPHTTLRVLILLHISAVEQAQAKVKQQLILDARAALASKWDKEQRADALRAVNIREAEAAEKTVKV
jgi:predicted metalloendopeptidase